MYIKATEFKTLSVTVIRSQSCYLRC